VWWMLPNGPEHAKWLSPAQRDIVRRDLLADSGTDDKPQGLGAVFRDPKVYLLAFGAFVSGCAGYFLAFWTPTIIKDMGVTDLQMIGLYAVIPNFFGIVAMVLYGRSSDRFNEQRLHWGLAFLVAAAGFLGLSWAIGSGSLNWTIAMIAIGGSALVSATPVFWSMATRYLPKQGAAAGIAFINTLASIAGISPAVVGAIKTQTGSLNGAIWLLSAMFVMAAVAVTLGMRKSLAGPAKAAA
jgi:cyanate permease